MESTVEEAGINSKNSSVKKSETSIGGSLDYSRYFKGVLWQVEQNQIQTLAFSQVQNVTLNPVKSKTYQCSKGRYHFDKPYAHLVTYSNDIDVYVEAGSNVFIWDRKRNKYFYHSLLSFGARYWNYETSLIDVWSDGRFIGIQVSKNHALIWDSLTRRWNRIDDQFVCITFLSAGQLIGAYSKVFKKRNALITLDLTTGRHVKSVDVDDLVTCLATLSTGLVVCGFSNGTLKLYDPINNRFVKTFEGHRWTVTCLATVSETQMLSGSEDGTLRLWNMESGECLKILKVDDVQELVVLAADRVMISSKASSYDSAFELKIWDLTSGVCVEEVKIRRNIFNLKNFHTNYLAMSSCGQMVTLGQTFETFDVLSEALSIENQRDLLRAIYFTNHSLTQLDLSGVDLSAISRFLYYPNKIIEEHPKLTGLRFDAFNLTPAQLKKVLLGIFKRRQLTDLCLGETPIIQDGNIIAKSFDAHLDLKKIKQALLNDLKTHSLACLRKGDYKEAVVWLEAMLNIAPESDVTWVARDHLATPFKFCANNYYSQTNFIDLSKRAARWKLMATAEDANKPHVQQLCNCFEQLFTLKFHETRGLATENKFGERIIPSHSDSAEEKLLDDLLSGWELIQNKTGAMQKVLIENLVGQYKKHYTGGYWFVVGKKEADRLLRLLKESRYLLSADEFLSLVDNIEATIVSDTQSSEGALWQGKPRLHQGLGICPELKLGLDALRRRTIHNAIPSSSVLPKQKTDLTEIMRSEETSSLINASNDVPARKVAVFSPIEVVKELIPSLLADHQKASHLFYFHLTARLSAYQTNAEVASMGYFKGKETGRGENIKAFSKAAVKLIVALTGPLGALLEFTGVMVKSGAGLMENAKPLFKLAKQGVEAMSAGSEMLQIVSSPEDKPFLEKLEEHIRLLVGESKLTKKDQLKQFATVFAGPFGSKALERFIQGLLWRYQEQLALLNEDGGMQLAEVVGTHLTYLFQLDFIDWKSHDIHYELEGQGQEQQSGMLKVMWYWVDRVNFLMKKDLSLLAKGGVEATVLIQQAGYQCLNEKDQILCLDIKQSDPEKEGMFFETQGQQWGYRRVGTDEGILESFAEELQRYRQTGCLNPTGKFTLQTLQRYSDHEPPVTKIKQVPFTWKSDSEEIVSLKSEVKTLSEKNAHLEKNNEVLKGCVEKVQCNAATAHAEAEKRKEELVDLKKNFKDFVAVFREPEGVDREEKIRSKADKLFHELSEAEKEVDQKESDSNNVAQKAVPISTEKPKKMANGANTSQEIKPSAVLPSLSEEQPNETFHYTPVFQAPSSPLVSISSDEEEWSDESSKKWGKPFG